MHLRQISDSFYWYYKIKVIRYLSQLESNRGLNIFKWKTRHLYNILQAIFNYLVLINKYTKEAVGEVQAVRRPEIFAVQGIEIHYIGLETIKYKIRKARFCTDSIDINSITHFIISYPMIQVRLVEPKYGVDISFADSDMNLLNRQNILGFSYRKLIYLYTVFPWVLDE